MATKEGYLGTTTAAELAAQVRPGIHRRVSWGAVFSGVVLVLAIQVLLSLLGIGVGMTTINPNAGANGVPEASSLGIGAAVWWTVSYLIALAIGGYVAARLAGVVMRGDGAIHGLVTWGFALLISAYLVTTALGSMIGGAFSALGSAASGVAQTAKQAAPQLGRATGISGQDLRNQAQDLLRPGDQQASGDQARDQLTGALTVIITGGPQADQARQQAVTIIAQRAGIPEDQARQRLQQFEQQANQLKQQATQTATQAAQKTTDTLSAAGIWGTIALILGAIVAAIFGALGTRSPREVVVATPD